MKLSDKGRHSDVPVVLGLTSLVFPILSEGFVVS